MHEELLVIHHDAIHSVALQVVFFLSAFQIYTYLQTFWVLVLFSVAFLWLTATLTNMVVIFGGVIGFVLAMITIIKFDLVKFRLFSYGIYYVVVQPAILAYLTPLYIPHTSYPVGYILAFLVWFLCNIFVTATGPVYDKLAFFYNTILSGCVLFFIAFFSYSVIFLAVGVTSLFQLVVVFRQSGKFV